MRLTATHTYAELEVSAAAYDEIAAKLRGVDYDHVFMEDGTIDMHGIGLTRAKAPAASDEKLTITWPKGVEPSSSYVAQHERACKFPYSAALNAECWCHERMGNDFWFLPHDACIYKKPNRWRDAWQKFITEVKRFWKDESSGGQPK